MEYRILGKTGLKISRLGFGGIPIQKIDAEGTKKLMGELIKEGVNYIDTARGYTVSEEYLGYALEGIRQHFVLATKSMSRTREAMAQDIDISLRNLRTDYIDLYQVHNPSPADWEPRHLTLARYFVDRYWLQTISDYDLVCRVKFAVISCLVIHALGGNLIETAQIYSKEIENSIDNVEAILDATCSAPP